MKPNRFAQAIQVQDAGNLCAIARLLVEVADEAMAETRTTTKVWEDPAVRLVVAKLAELCRVGASADDTFLTFSRAYDECNRRSDTDKTFEVTMYRPCTELMSCVVKVRAPNEQAAREAALDEYKRSQPNLEATDGTIEFGDWDVGLFETAQVEG